MHTPTLVPSLEEKLSALSTFFQKSLRTNEALMSLLRELVEREPGDGWEVGVEALGVRPYEVAWAPDVEPAWEQRNRAPGSYVRLASLVLSFSFLERDTLRARVAWKVGWDGLGEALAHWHVPYGWPATQQRAFEAKQDLLRRLEATNAPRAQREPFRRGEHVQVVWDNGQVEPRAIVCKDEQDDRVDLGLGWVRPRVLFRLPKSEK